MFVFARAPARAFCHSLLFRFMCCVCVLWFVSCLCCVCVLCCVFVFLFCVFAVLPPAVDQSRFLLKMQKSYQTCVMLNGFAIFVGEVGPEMFTSALWSCCCLTSVLFLLFSNGVFVGCIL